jgi:2-aminoethylphosphonate-pyruvate transaminase
MILLNPGPVTLSERVRNALLGPDLCHREVEFSRLQHTIRDALLKVYDLDPKQWAAILLTGSGTAAVEAMITSLVPSKGRLLVIENGVYGERVSNIAAVYGIDHLRLTHSWVEKIDVRQLEHLLDENEDITHAAVVHHETTTGRLNDLDSIVRICQARNVSLLVDAVSSFGAEEIDFTAEGIAGCAATANKCLHGVPGTSFVITRRSALSQCSTARNLYLSLSAYCRQQDLGGTPFTQSVQTFYALAEALKELVDQGGWRKRQQHYAQLIGLVRNGMKGMGIKPLLADGESSVVLHSFHLPQGMGYDEFHDQLKRNGYVIYAGQGELAKSIFRVSTMGAVNLGDMERFLSVTSEIYP